MAAHFTHLFKPMRIGPIEVPNRICFSAHGTFMAEGYLPTERQAHYFAERARGGAGWIVIGGSPAHPSSAEDQGMNLVSDERAIPGYRRITEMVHEHGAKICTQMDLYGDGVPSPRPDPGPIYAPSWRPAPYTGEQPKALEEEDMEMLISVSERAVHVAREGGFDGVELLISFDFSLMHNFLSPRRNDRSDEYGGNLDNRMRFPLRMIQRVRRALGREHVLGIKLIGDEMAEVGLDQEALQEIAVRFAAAGDLDYIHVCLGSDPSYTTIVPEMSYPAGFASYLAAGVRDVVDIPVLAVKRINDPIVAERILADGHADMVAMARALIADPELPNKAREGRLDEIRQCTGSNQECLRRAERHTRFPIRCIHNPAVGHEATLGVGSVRPATEHRKVVVVGGGPGGMRAAKVAAQRGHDVHLYERAPELGGQVRSILQVASRQDYESVIRYLIREIDRRGVHVHLGQHLTADDVLTTNADAVILATGALPWKTGWTAMLPHVARMPGVDEPHVFSGSDVWSNRDLGPRVVVIDELGEAEGAMTAEHLADQGKEVTLVTRLEDVARRLDGMSWGAQVERFLEKGVEMVAQTLVSSVEGRRVRGTHVTTRKPWEVETDSVVLVMGKQPDDELYFSLKGRAPDLRRVGDCVTPRKITDAIWEGTLAGRAV